jgi:hypothetical protein
MNAFGTRLAGALALGLFSTGTALADEAWDTQLGRVYWESDMGDMAILRIDNAGGGVAARIYLPGLAGDMMGGRGSYHGYWIAAPDDDGGCGAQLIGPDGFKSDQWGQTVLTFVHDDFPSDWAGTYTECFDSAAVPISGVAIVGGE